MSGKKLLYVAMRLRSWDNALELGGRPLKLSQVGVRSIGFLEVFDSLEKLQEQYGETPAVIAIEKDDDLPPGKSSEEGRS